MFLSSARFFENLGFFRGLWARGRLGGGKTLVCVAIGHEFVTNEVLGCQYCFTNFPCVLPKPPRDDRGNYQLFHTVCIFDESWSMIDARDFQKNERVYGAYARKLGNVVLYPSVHSIDKRARVMYCERIARLDMIPGGLWVYKWGVDLGYVSDQGLFMLWKPDTYFPMYDSSFIPDGDYGLSGSWHGTIETAKQRQGAVEVSAGD